MRLTSPTDNEIIVAMAKAASLSRGPEPQFLWQEWQVEMKAALAVAEPLITKRAQEAVLRKMLERAQAYQVWDIRHHVEAFVRSGATELGIDLEGGANG